MQLKRDFGKAEELADTDVGRGLYLTRRIVTAHGGTVGVRNRPEEGALFTLRLPLHDPSSADRETARQSA